MSADFVPEKSVEYRSANASDAEAIAALHARSWRETCRGAYQVHSSMETSPANA